METIVWSVHVLVAVVLVVLVLMQQGKGADMGAAFGSGSSGSLFGASGSSNFMSRATAIMAAVFFCTSLSLTYLANHQTEDLGVMGGLFDAVKDSSVMGESQQEEQQDNAVPAATEDSSSNAGQIPN